MKKIIIIILALTALISPLYAQIRNSPIVDSEFDEAEKLFFQRKYNFARESFLYYLERRPLQTNDMLYYYIGATYFQDKQYSNAIHYYKIAFDLNDSYIYGNSIANSYYQITNYNEAIIWYRRAIDRTYSPFKPVIAKNIEEYEVINQNIVTNITYIGTNDLYSFLPDEYLISVTEEETLSTNTVRDITSATNIADATAGIINTNIQENTLKEEPLKVEQLEIKNITLSINNNIDKLFFYGDFFTNIITTNIYTNTSSITNTTVTFETNNDVFLIPYNASDETASTTTDTNNTAETNDSAVVIPDDTIASTDTTSENNIFTLVNVTNETIENGAVIVTNDIITFDEYSTKAIYYNAYLHMGHTLLRMKDYTNAALSYEIFLTNVGDAYYQKDSLERVINAIRNRKMVTNFVPLTNGYRVFTNTEMTTTTDIVDIKGNINKKVVLATGDETSYKENEIDEYLYKTTYGVTVKNTLHPSGKKVIEVVYPNGDIKKDTFYEDGSKSIWIKMYDGDVYEYIEEKDASFVKRNNIKTDDSETISVFKSDGSIIKNTRTKDFISHYNRSVDGGNINRIEYFNGDIVRESVMPDGTIINQKNMNDGSATVLVNYKDGRIANTQTDTNGVSTTQIHLPDGSTQTRVSKDFVAMSFSYKTVLNDGTIIIKTVLDDGTIKIDKQSKDGSKMVETIFTDGRIETETRENDASIKKSTLASDGSAESITEKTDGTVIRENVNSDGSYLLSTNYADGGSETFSRDIDGVEINKITDSLGSYSTSTKYKDGRTVINKKFANGNTINIDSNAETTRTEAGRDDGAKIIIEEKVGVPKSVMVYDSVGGSMTKENASFLIIELLGSDYNVDVDMVQNILVDVPVDVTESEVVNVDPNESEVVN